VTALLAFLLAMLFASLLTIRATFLWLPPSSLRN
jgi:hypothetical protein